jgi:hypothetical protein
MLKLISKHSQCYRLRLRLGLFGRCTISKGARNVHHLCDPPAIFFLIEFNPKDHQNLCVRQFYRSDAESPTALLSVVSSVRITL